MFCVGLLIATPAVDPLPVGLSVGVVFLTAVATCFSWRIVDLDRRGLGAYSLAFLIPFLLSAWVVVVIVTALVVCFGIVRRLTRRFRSSSSARAAALNTEKTDGQ